MSGGSTMRDIYDRPTIRPGEPTLVNLLRKDIYRHPFSGAKFLRATPPCPGSSQTRGRENIRR
jgi:hypothetical protein